ncbi:MAG: DUF4393 domain-containing protein [Armatimonadia bacterium]|nr:DUF4393 domain-containing protein [Armatimonadia bacterium]
MARSEEEPGAELVPDAAEKTKLIADLAKAFPFYQDFLQPAAQELGEGLREVARTVNHFLLPLKGLNALLQPAHDWLDVKLASELQGVPEARIQTPPPNVYLPAIQGLVTGGFSEDLRDMYVKLLATAMDKETALDAHPAFARILSEMTPDEARIMRVFATDHASRPAITLDARLSSGQGEAVHVRHFSLLGIEAECEYPESTPVYLSNLVRLGLLEIPGDTSVADRSRYAPLQKSETFLAFVKEIEGMPDREPHIHREAVSLTNMGHRFCDVCVDAEVQP